MGVYKKNNRWYLDYYIPENGKRRREVVTIPGIDPSKITRRDAEKALSIRKGQIAEGKFNISQTRKSILFDKLSYRYLEYCKSNKKAWKRDESTIKNLKDSLKHKTLTQVTAWQIEKYKSKRTG